jgi:hypothetical protein
MTVWRAPNGDHAPARAAQNSLPLSVERPLETPPWSARSAAMREPGHSRVERRSRQLSPHESQLRSCKHPWRTLLCEYVARALICGDAVIDDDAPGDKDVVNPIRRLIRVGVRCPIPDGGWIEEH